MEDIDESELFGRFSQGSEASDSSARRLRFSEIPVNPTELPNATHDRADRLKVFVRARPLANGEAPADMMLSENAVSIRTTKASAQGRENLEETTFSFDTVFDATSTQEEVFAQTMLPQLRSLVKKHDTLTFAYGITNAGKTYTVQGKGDGDEMGLLPRALKVLFGALEQQAQRAQDGAAKEGDDARASSSSAASSASTAAFAASLELDDDCTYEMRASFLEVYGNDAYDLLAPPEPKGPFGMGGYKRKALKVKEGNGQVFVDGLKEVDLPDVDSAQRVLQMGWTNRVSASNGVNMDSSRSHAVLCVKLIATSKADGSTSATRLCVVDLAGAERQKKTGADGARLNEAMSINKDLMVLGNCLRILRHNQLHARKDVAPFRESTITKLFRDYLSGSGQISVIAALSPRVDDAYGSLETLKFAAVASKVKPLGEAPRVAPSQAKPAHVPRCAVAGGAAGHGQYRAAAPPRPRPTPVAESHHARQEAAADGSAASEWEVENEQLRQQVIALQERLVSAEAERLSRERTIREEVAAEMQEARERFELEMSQRYEAERFNTEELNHKRLELIQGNTGARAEQASVLAHTENIQQQRDIKRREAEHAAQLKKVESELELRRAELAQAQAELLTLRGAAPAADVLAEAGRRAEAAEAAAAAERRERERLAHELAESEMAKEQAQSSVEGLKFRLDAECEAKAALQASVAELNERLTAVTEMTRASRRKSARANKKGGDAHRAASSAAGEGGGGDAEGAAGAAEGGRPSLGDLTGSSANVGGEADDLFEASPRKSKRRSILGGGSSSSKADGKAASSEDGKKPSKLKQLKQMAGLSRGTSKKAATEHMESLDMSSGFFDLGAPPTAPPPMPEPTPISRRTRAGRAAAQA